MTKPSTEAGLQSHNKTAENINSVLQDTMQKSQIKSSRALLSSWPHTVKYTEIKNNILLGPYSAT